MELTNEFVIDRDVEETWTVLNDLEFIAPCMPGAQLTEIEGDEYRGLVKIKVGPITAQYKGKASFVEQDAEAKVSKLKAEGRDPRQGNANALVTASMEAVGDSQTKVNIHTDLGLSGRIASFGRGAIEDVSKKLLTQFTDNLQAKLESEGPAGSDSGAADNGAGAATTSAASAGETAAAATAGSGAEPASSSAGTSSTAASSPAGTSSTTAPSTGVRKISGPEAAPVDLMEMAGGTVAKRAIPAAGGLALVALILYWILGRG